MKLRRLPSIALAGVLLAVGLPAAPRQEMGPVTTVFATLTGVYGGYFGAGSGVMMVAVLGLGTDLELRVVNGLKTLAILASNVVATAVFLVFAELDWTAIGLLAYGSWWTEMGPWTLGRWFRPLAVVSIVGMKVNSVHAAGLAQPAPLAHISTASLCVEKFVVNAVTATRSPSVD